MRDDKTKWIFEDEGAPERRPAGGTPYAETIRSAADATSAAPTDLAARTTRLVASREETVIYQADAGFAPKVDPVVGWLVIVKGPGLGHSLTLGGGVNAIGRDPGERVALPFGDQLISGRDQARIIDDDEERTFFIAPGSGKNVTRVERQVVGNTMPLKSRSTIQLSKATHLRFVAFCDPGFDWSDLAPREDGAPE